MRTRARTAVGVLAVAGVTAVGVAVYRARTAGHAEVHAITERAAVAMAAGDRAALSADPKFQNHPGTVDWLVAHGPALAVGYRVSVQRNGANSYRLMSPDVVSHVGQIETAVGTISLGFWRDPDGGRLTFVTAAASIGPLPVGRSAGDTPGIEAGPANP